MVFGVVGAIFAAACGGGPGIKKCEPEIGSINGGEEVRIRGSGLRSDLAYTVYLGNVRAPSSVVEGDDTLIVMTPSRPIAGIVDVRVVSGDGKTFLLRGGFSYIDAAEWNPGDTLGGGSSKAGGRKRRVVH